MDILDRILAEEISIDFGESDDEDINELSDILGIIHPNNNCDIEWNYPTLMSFYDDYGNDEVCFFNRAINVWDGYGTYEGAAENGYKNLMTAKEILDEYYGSLCSTIDENEVMEMFMEDA